MCFVLAVYAINFDYSISNSDKWTQQRLMFSNDIVRVYSSRNDSEVFLDSKNLLIDVKCPLSLIRLDQLVHHSQPIEQLVQYDYCR